jgi:Methyltransferase domain
MEYIPGKYESVKFADRKERYYEGLGKILSMGYTPEEIIHHFPAFVGHMTISRFLALYELYQQTLGVAGHIAECGVYKGAGTLMFAKLAQIFEPESLTLVHGFDWFQGNEPTFEEPNVLKGSYFESYERVKELVSAQGLDHLVHLHKLDLTKDLNKFFQDNNSIQFKLVFLDAGIYDIVKHCIENLWPRITPGGILVFDQFNHELAPGESRAIKELLPTAKIKTFPWGWMPTAYIVKE